MGGGTGAYCLGIFNCGTVFSINSNTGAEKVLYSFCNQQNCADGAAPAAGLINVNGTLYGTTYMGGVTGCIEDLGCGTVFSLDPNTGAEKVLYSFCSQQNCSDGAQPEASMMEVNGILHGTTVHGGAGCGGEGCGTVFSLDPNTGDEEVLYSFCSQQNCADGEVPISNLINVKGMLYGVTGAGGSANCTNYGASCGTAFSIDPSTGAEKVLHSFCILRNCRDGRQPQSGLIDVNGVLYGTTMYGGERDSGTVFALTPKL